MKFGIVGLGRMGGNLASRPGEGHEVVDTLSPREEGVRGRGRDLRGSLSGLAEALPSRVSSSSTSRRGTTEQTVNELGEHLEAGDVIVEAGNSHWEDSKRRYAKLRERGVHFLDCGTSGGVEGARRGACFMVGGDGEAFLLVNRSSRTSRWRTATCMWGRPGRDTSSS
jgi:6-phosphogluconate dehydrogenase